MSCISIRFRLLLIVGSLCSWITTALPTGSVGCEGGRAAVSGLHASQQTVLTGPLSQDNIEFQLNGVALQPGVPFNIDIGADNRWRLITAGTFFRGFLVRLGRGSGNVDTRQSLATASLTAQVAEAACLDAYWVGGVTHNSNVLKNVEEGTLRVHLPSQNMPLDVTVVIQNRNGYSIYYYSGFTIHANAVTVPTAGQIDSPTVPTYTPYYPPPTGSPSDSIPTAVEAFTLPPAAPPINLPPSVPMYVGGPPTVTAPPITAPPITAPPVTAPPVTVFPWVAPSSITEAPITEAPITAAPITNPPITAAPITAAPVTAPPITAAPITHAPITQPPITRPPMAQFAPPTDPPVQQFVFLRYPTCSPDAPCAVCQGDCDTNDDCVGALECFHRPQDDTSPIPGCSGVGVAGRDYCYAPKPNSLRPRMPECTADLPCGMCEGDCDDSTECAPGLTCFTRGQGDLTPILGCDGLGIAGLDYCYNASEIAVDREDNVTATNQTIPIGGIFGNNASAATPTSPAPVPTTALPMSPTTSAPMTPTTPAPVTAAPMSPPTTTAPENEDFSSNDQADLTDTGCTDAAPCSRCEGDCQGDDGLCVGSLSCFVRPDNDMTRVLGCGGAGTPGADYCWTPIANVLYVRPGSCSSDRPCSRCEGSCGDDSECSGDLRCFRRRDLSVVPGCGNGFFGVSFCWDPNDLNFGGGRHLLRH
ncbi:AAI [Seminavis robusta]|uniref:AAI n=1 Tax=Seminavis robusta TaxID=568900 RepID=A0A9N8HIL3_9STRA|nr:AAI [Seminavis robusta]|eukprot:Sro628_g178100.1 AAI (702) ;mRNA; r:37741-40214